MMDRCITAILEIHTITVSAPCQQTMHSLNVFLSVALLIARSKKSTSILPYPYSTPRQCNTKVSCIHCVHPPKTTNIEPSDPIPTPQPQLCSSKISLLCSLTYQRAFIAHILPPTLQQEHNGCLKVYSHTWTGCT